MIKEFICIICPRSCKLTVTTDTAYTQDTADSTPSVQIRGNRCKRGADYGKQEALCPMRILTTTVACLVSAHTDRLACNTAQQNDTEPKQKHRPTQQPGTTIHPEPQADFKKTSAAQTPLTAAPIRQVPVYIRLPVKTGCEIPLAEMQTALDHIRTISVSAPVSCGDMLGYIQLKNGTAIPIIACSNAEPADTL